MITKLFPFLIWVISLNVFAHLWVSESQPNGEAVDHDIKAITLKFSQPLLTTGSSAPLSEEHRSKISFSPAIDCALYYQSTDSVICHLKAPLAPQTTYSIKVRSGLKGAQINEKLTYDFDKTFTTKGLSVTNYVVNWKEEKIAVEIKFNFGIQNKNLSGAFYCHSKTIKSSVAISKNPQFDVTAIALESLPDNEPCYFKFNQPLFYSKYPGSFQVKKKVLIFPGLEQVAGNPRNVTIQGSCTNSYYLRSTISPIGIPEVMCEATDEINLTPTPGLKDTSDFKKYVEIIPSDGVVIKDQDGVIKLSNFKKPNQLYILKFLKNSPLKNNTTLNQDLFIQIEPLDSPPILGIRKQEGVIERIGPWDIPYSVQNIKGLALNYDFSTDENLMIDSSLDLDRHRNYTKSLAINPEVKINENTLLPLDLKSLGKENKIQSGFVIGNLAATDIEERFIDSKMALKNADYGEVDYTKNVPFSFLITDLGLHFKRAEKGSLVWAYSLNTGKPLSNVNVKIKVYGGGKNHDYNKKTDSNGLASFDDIILDENDVANVYATHGQDISFLETQKHHWDRGISNYEFNLGHYYYGERIKDIVGDVVAERPLYLPGEEARLKLFVRKRIPDSIELAPIGKHLSVTIIDSRDADIHTAKVTLNKYGTASFSYQLPGSSPTGHYSIKISDGRDTIHLAQAFQVEEFRKPEFKVTMSETKDDYTGVVSYFKGGAVKDTSGESAVMFEKLNFHPKDPILRSFTYPKSMGYEYSYDYEDYNSAPANNIKIISRENLKTDEEGKFVIHKKDLNLDINSYGRIIVEGIFQDSNGGNISGRIENKIIPYSVFPGIKFSDWYYQTNQKIGPEVVILNADGLVVKDVKGKITVNRVDYIYERRLGSGNYFYYDSRKEVKETGTCNFKSTENFSSCDFKFKESGYYEFSVKIDDSSIKSDVATRGVYVYGDGDYLGFNPSNHDRINLTVENNDLKLGDTFKLMAISPLQDGEALITFERDGILFKKQLSFKGNVILFDKLIDDEKYIPGFYVSLVIIKGRTSDKIEGNVDLGKPAFKIGYARVEVATKEKRLTPVITLGRKTIEPGKELEAQIKLQNYKGNSTQGELAIAVVDDALLSLTSNYKNNYNILDTFYSLGKLGVRNFQTLTQLIGRRTFGKKGANAGGGGGFEVRSNFQNTALWIPHAETDKDGNYKLKFKVPDNLTTWRIIAIAVDEKHHFGFAEDDFLVSKPLMIEPKLPNFLISGDEFNAKIMVTNRTGSEQQIQVEAKVSQMTVKDTKKELRLKNDEQNPVFFLMSTVPSNKHQNEADLLFTAKASADQDAFKIKLPVLANAQKNVQVTFGVMKETKLDLPLTIARDAYPDSLSMNLSYSTSIVNGLDEVFSYVLGYPYGCWEQRLTKAYFLAQYQQLKPVLTYRFEGTDASISKAIQDLLYKAHDYQTPSGGMRYYPGGSDHPSPYLSIFTAFSYQMLKKAGYKTDSKSEADLRSYLKTLLNDDRAWENDYGQSSRLDNRAFILNVLDELGEKNLEHSAAKLFAAKDQMDLFGLSYLMGYLNKHKNLSAESQTINAKLTSLKTSSIGTTFFKAPLKMDLDENKYWDYTENRDQCVVLQNLVDQSNDKVEMAMVARSVLKGLKGGRWYNTQENIHCFEGLRRFIYKFEKKLADVKLSVKIDDENSKVVLAEKDHSKNLNFSADDIKVSNKKLTLEKNSKDEIYYANILRYSTPHQDREKIDAGFNLTKKIFKLQKNGGNSEWVELTDKVIKIKRSDLLKIELDISTNQTRHQVMLNDPLAGCFEPVNTQLATSSMADATLVDNSKKITYEWETAYYKGSFEYMDLRLQAAQFYSRKLNKGNSHAEYLVQAIATGTFTMPEATVEEMYYPDVRGTESVRKFIVEE